MGAPAPNAALPVRLAAVAGHRRKTAEHGDFLARAGAHFGEAGEHANGGDGPDAGDREQDLEAAGQHRVACDDGLNGLLEADEAAFDRRDAAGKLALQ